MFSDDSFDVGANLGNYARMQGCKRSTQKPPHFSSYRPERFGAGDLPTSVDLRDDLSPVEDQSAVSSCTANAIAGAYEYLAMREFGESGDVSRLFIYYNARQLRGDENEDAGSSITAAIEALQTIGVCSELTWPYDPDSVLDEPSEEAYIEAENYRLESAQEIAVDLFAMKHCLAEGYPFAFGLSLFQSFDEIDENGYIPMPSEDETSRSSHGAHAMICVGYDDEESVFIVRNSWGEDWGDAGYCYIPYDYMTNPDLCWDCWAVQAVSDLDYEDTGIDTGENVEEEVIDETAEDEGYDESEKAVEDEDYDEDGEELEDSEYDEAGETIYLVQSGDSLYSIAEAVYGDGELWQDLYAANIDVIGDDPDYIEAGLELVLPEL